MSSKRTRGLIALLLCAAAPAAAQTVPSTRPVGRVSIYLQTLTSTPDDGPAVRSAEVVTAIQLSPPDGELDALEYSVDMRHRDATDRPDRLSLYDAYVGARFGNGRARVRLGRMWLPDLGGLGSVAGGLAEYRRTGLGRIGSQVRVGVFGGLEPETYGIRNVARVRKLGIFATLDGSAGRRHTAGLIRMSQSGLTERSVLTVSNFVPLQSRVFVYQTAEYDLVGPAGQPGGGLSYVMINAHGSPGDRVDVQGVYHRGRSVDARTVTDDVLNGRPLRPGALEGWLYESAGGRVIVRVADGVRVHAGYARDRNNRDSAATGRTTIGASAANVARTGIDAAFSDALIHRPNSDYHARYVSAGRRIGSAIYVSAEYSTSLSVGRFTRSDGVTVETRPRTRQISASAILTLTRALSLVTLIDRTRDDLQSDLRVQSGLTVRLR
jgi:hypothetical protein